MLTFYAEHKEFDNIKRTIEVGAKVNAKDSEGYNALIYTCGMSYGIKPSFEIAKYLIDHGAKVNVRAKGGFTPLSEACSYGNYEIVKLLLESGADPNVKGQYNTPALISGANSPWGKDSLRIVKILIEHGANVNDVPKRENNALLEVIAGNNFKPDVAKYLIDSGIDLEYVGSFESTALAEACEKGYLDLVKYMLEKGVDVNFTAKRVDSPLVNAFRGDHIDVVMYLLEKGADHTAKSGFGEDLITYAGEHGHTEILDFLEKKKKVSFTKSLKSTKEALANAAMDGHLNVIKRLKESGVDMIYGLWR